MICDLSLSSHRPIFFHLFVVTPMCSVVLAMLIMHLLPGVSLMGFDSDRGWEILLFILFLQWSVKIVYSLKKTYVLEVFFHSLSPSASILIACSR